MSNILEANSIVAYQRASNGTLTLAGEFATGGQGGDFTDTSLDKRTRSVVVA